MSADQSPELPRAAARAGEPMPYSACIINHNGAQHLAATLAAVLTQDPPPAELMLVDSGSTDDSLELARARVPDARIIALGENLGPAVARNVGIRTARHHLVLFVDDDVSLDPGCARNLAAALAEHPKAAAAMPWVYHAHAPDQIQYTGASVHFAGSMMLHERNTSADDGPHVAERIGSLVSACFLLDRSRVPGLEFDEAFFIYFEDHDFALRARMRGAELLSVSSARCLHGPGSAGLSIRRTGQYVRLRVLFLVRNRWRLVLKCYELRTLVLLAPVLIAYELCQLIVVAAKGWGRIWLEAAWSLLVGLRLLRRERMREQRLRSVPDRLLLDGGPLPFRAELATNTVERVGLRALNWLTSAYWRVIRPVL